MQFQYPAVTDAEFYLFQGLVEREMGIHLPPHKKPLLVSRLSKRLVQRNCASFKKYYDLIHQRSEVDERQIALELITTNETFFFREEKHFDYMQNRILPELAPGQALRVWSAASSTGEEPYSIAMVLASYCRGPWQIFASDINSQVLLQAQRGIYPVERAIHLPDQYKLRYCKRGLEEFSGHLRVVSELRSKVEFGRINLMDPFTAIGQFDLIFLRNVMIYFERKTQIKLIERLRSALNIGGHLFVGHSESLHGISDRFEMIQPAVYRVKA